MTISRHELNKMVSDGILGKLCVSFSRDDEQDADAPRYVQDNIKLHGGECSVFRTSHVFVLFNSHTTKHLHSGTFVLNGVMFMFRSGGLGNGCFFP